MTSHGYNEGQTWKVLEICLKLYQIIHLDSRISKIAIIFQMRNMDLTLDILKKKLNVSMYRTGVKNKVAPIFPKMLTYCLSTCRNLEKE